MIPAAPRARTNLAPKATARQRIGVKCAISMFSAEEYERLKLSTSSATTSSGRSAMEVMMKSSGICKPQNTK